jgi:hypothetical protein
MQFHYTKIENLSFNDSPLYFRTPLTKEFIRATIFSEKYVYFHTTSLLDNDMTDTKCLGNFIKMNKLKNEDEIINKDRLPFYYEFQLGNVYCNKNGKTEGEIYLIGIPDSDENMIQLENIFYKDWPVFYTI